MRLKDTNRLAKKTILLIIVSILFLITIQSLFSQEENNILIQPDKAQYTIGETVYASVSGADTSKYNLYYEYEGLAQRYMGDFSSFSFIPRGIGMHYLTLRDKAGNEIERASFEVMPGEEPAIPEAPEETPIPSATPPEQPSAQPVPIPTQPAPIPKQGLTPLKSFFKQQEDAEFELSYEPKEKIKFLGTLKQKGEWQSPREKITAELIDTTGNQINITPEYERLEDGKFRIIIPAQRAFRAGRYSLRVELITEGTTYVEEQDFLWGVLAINTHKSVYLLGEEAFIGMAVLDDQGHMVCDANVTLQITDPDGIVAVLSTSDGSIMVSDECNVYGVTDLPDYYTHYDVGSAGNYSMNLTAVTSNGVRSLIDNFVVQDSVEFDVERQGPTRIYPFVPYTMNFTIKANQDYFGPVLEYVPADFVITPQEGLTVTIIDDAKVLSWNANLRAGETYALSYEFDAPDITPYLFTLGPLEIGDWKEAREWMIASDATIYTFLASDNGNVAYRSEWDETTFNKDDVDTVCDATCLNQTNTSNDVRFTAGGDASNDAYFAVNWTVSSGAINWAYITMEGQQEDSGNICAMAVWNWTLGNWYNVVAPTSCDDTDVSLTYNISGTLLSSYNNGGRIATAFYTYSTAGNTLQIDYAGLQVSYNATINFSTPTTNDSDVFIGDSVNHTVTVQTGVGSTLQNYTFSWNASGFNCDAWANVSTGGLSGSVANIGVVQTIPTACDGKTVGWRIYVNNSDSITNSTDIDSYLVHGYPPTVTSASVAPRFALNNSVVNISADVTDDIAVSTVIARILYPNGTSAANYTMTTGGGGSIYWNASYTANFGIPGQYNVTIFANDTSGSSVTALVNFTPILNLSNQTDIVIGDGSFADWSDASVPSIDDSIGDSGTAGETIIDNELLIQGFESDTDNITIMEYNNVSAQYENVWSNNDETYTASGSRSGGNIGDVNHDGKNDFAITRVIEAAYNFGVWSYNSSNSEWYVLWNISLSPRLGGIKDFDNDSLNEIFLKNTAAASLDPMIYSNDTINATSFSLNTTIKNCSLTSVYFPASGDLNGNGIPELLFQCVTNGSVEIWEYNSSSYAYEWRGNVTLPPARINPANARLMDDGECGDIDGDKADECVVCGNSGVGAVVDYSGGTYYLAYNSSQTPNSADLSETCSVGDVTNDGRADWIEVINGYGVRVYSYNSTSSGYYHVWNDTSSTTVGSIGVSFIGDSDNDGKGEFIIHDTGSLYIYENDSVNATSFSNTFTFTGVLPGSVIIGDFDTDGSTGTGGGGNNFDIANYSLANNATYLFARISVNGSIDFSTATNYYAVYLSTNDPTTGSQYTAGGGLLPFLYDYRLQVNNSNCTIYNSTNATRGACNYSNNSNTIELRANLSLINMTAGSVVNITFETGGSSYDFAPDTNSFLQYSTGAGEPGGNNPPTLDNYDTNPDTAYTGDDLKFNITCSDVDGGDTITGYLQIFNGTTSFKNFSLVVNSGEETTLWTVGNGNTSKGQNWNASYWCGDAMVNTSKSYDNVTIQNTAPTNPSSLSLNDVNVSDTLTAGCDGSSDGDSDSINYHYYFFNVNDTGELQAWSDDNDYVIQVTDAHDTINVTCKATTADANSSGDYTNSTTVDDSHPTNPTSLGLNAVNVSDTLTAGCGGSSDADNDDITYHYYFFNVNDTGELQAWSDDNDYVIQVTDAHDTINVTCKATTTYENSSANFTNQTAVDDSHPSLPTLDLPDDLNITNDNTTYFNWTTSSDADNDGITYGIEIDEDSGFGSVDQSDYAVATNEYTATALTDGVWYWHVKSITSYENSSYTTYRTLTIDATPPSVNSISPVTGNWTNINTPNFYFNYSDSLSPNASCILYIGATNKGSNSSVINDTQTNITAPSTNDGTYNWNITCTDLAGNSAGSTARTINIDTNAPTVNINTSLNNTVFTTDTPSIDFNYSDSLSPNASCILYFDDSSVDTNASTLNWTDTVLTASSQSDANYSVYVNCTDKAGKIGKSDVLNIEVDTTAPAITGVLNDSITANSARVNWTTDEEANSSVKYGPDETLAEGEEVSSDLVTEHSIQLSGLSDSTLYYYNITSCDAQGWCNTSGPYNFTTMQLTINISLSLDPNPVNINSNVSFYGHANQSNGTNIANNIISIYLNNTQYYYNNNTALLENTTTWWNTSYAYRTKINITSDVATNLNNTIVLVNLSTSDLISQGKMNSDCGDTRFTDNSGNEIQYTLETSTCNSANTIFWAWTNLTGNTNNTIYAYYGNNAATIPTSYNNPDTGLVLYYHFDNSSAYGENNTRINDFSNKWNDGNCSSCPTWNSTGRYGGAYEYHGNSTSEFFDTGADISWSNTSNYSIGFWMKPRIVTINHGILGKTSTEWRTRLSSAGTFRFTLWNTTSNGGVILETTNIPANSWTHIFITYNGATGTGTLYRNGTQITTTPMQGPAKDTSDNVYIGAAYNLADSGTWYFNGSIDEVRIYNRTLTLEEIQAHYNATAPNYIQNHSLPRTDNDGNYNYTYTPTQPGEYTIKANTTYDSMSAEKTDILTVSSVNHEPTIDSVDAVPSQAPNPEAEKIVTVNFTVTDTNGISDLNHSSAKAIFNKSGITRSGNCSNNTIDSDTVEYNCSVPMQYYDEPGSWTINVTIIDNAQASAYNATTTFSYQELLYIQVDPVVFGFGDFYPGDNDQAASSNPLQIDNMGNVNLTIINITAYNLVNGSYTLGVSNITVNVSNGAGGTALQDSVSVNIPGANVSLDADGIDANESLYFYITIPNILPLYYSSSTEWVITADT